MINPINRIIVVARTQAKADYTKAQIAPFLPSTNTDFYSENIIPLACDHSSLDSVRQFVVSLRKRLDETYNTSKWATNGIDVMCLNAACLMERDSPAQFTTDGFEVTFQTNYLAPFLIANLTLDLLNPGGRIVLSTSGLHARERLNLSGMMKDGKTGEARKGFEMVDGTSFHYKRSYALSKQCNVVLCAELSHRLKPRGIVVNCFSPGLMTTSGLFRNQRACCKGAGMFHNKDVLAKEKAVGWGAGALVFMAIADETGRRSGEYWRDADSVLGWDSVYGKHFCPISVSEDQIDRHMRKQLWEMSSQLTEIAHENFV